MIIYERIFELTENELKYGGFRDYIINELIDEPKLLTIARSNHYEALLSLVEKAYKLKYNDKNVKNIFKELFNYILSFEIDLNDKYAYLFDKSAKQ